MTTRNELRALVPEASQEAFDDFVDVMESEIEELKQTVKERDEELDERNSEAESALTTVRYWLHDGLFLRKPIEPPQRILRVVERALGI